MDNKYDAIIVGGGISGLGIGALLSMAGRKVLLLEKKKVVGGRAATFRKDGVIRSIGQHTPMHGMKLETLFDVSEKLQTIQGSDQQIQVYPFASLPPIPIRSLNFFDFSSLNFLRLWHFPKHQRINSN